MFLGSAKRLAGWQRFTDYRHEQLAQRVVELEKKVATLLPQPVENEVNTAKK